MGSSSFRKKHETETLTSLKERNSRYYHLSKLVIEAVNAFGINGVNDGEYGPFHCGLNCVLNIPSFAIYLKGPCSTSKDIEISINFAKRDGVIISLQNDK